MTSKLIAGGIGLGRAALGMGLLAAPKRVGRGWVGDDVYRTGGRVALRAAGARDFALGAGLLVALMRGKPAAAWLLAGAFADIADASVAAGAFSKLPPTGRVVTIALAAASAVLSLTAARTVDARSSAAVE